MSSTYSHQEAEAVREYVKTLPESLWDSADDFVALRLTRAEVEAYVATAKNTGHSWWKDAVDEEFMADLEAAMGNVKAGRGIKQGKEHVTTVRVNLSEADKNVLRNEYAGVTDLVFQLPGRGEPVEHGRAKVASTVAVVQMRRAIPANARVLEVGARAEHAIYQGVQVGKYMGTMPIMNSADVQRHSQANRNVKLMLARTGAHALKGPQRVAAQTYVNDFSALFTRQKVQDVVWPTDVVMSRDSGYDLRMDVMPQIMRRNGARLWYGSMMRCVQAASVTDKAVGHLSAVGCDYEIDCRRDSIKFSFRSSSKPYVHSLSVYRDYVSFSERVFDCGGVKFVYTVLPQTTSAQLLYAMYAVPSADYCHDPTVFIPTGGAGRLRISTAAVEQGSRDLSRVGASVFEVEESDFSRMLQDRMLQKKVMEDGEVCRLIRGARVGMVVNGVRVSSETRMATSLIKPMAVVLNVVAYDLMSRGERFGSVVEQTIRAGGYKKKGLWHTACDVVWDAALSPGALVGLVLGDGATKRAGLDVAIDRVPWCERKYSPVVSLEDTGQVYPPSMCLCEERREVELMLEGERGGLSIDEAAALRVYWAELRDRVCAVCQVPDDAVFVDCPDQADVFAEVAKHRKLSATDTAGDSESCHGSTTSEDDDDFVESLEYSETSSRSSSCGFVGQQSVPPATGPARDASEEYVDVLTRQMEAADSEAVETCRVLALSEGFDERGLKAHSEGRVTHHLLKVSSGLVSGIVNDTVDPQMFLRVYDYLQDKFYDVNRVKGSRQLVLPARCSSLVYTNSDFLIRNQPKLIRAVDCVLANFHYGPVLDRIKFVNGCFGNGKTTKIAAMFRTGDLYLTSTANSAATFRKKVYGDSPVGRERCRTFDSAVCHGMPTAQRMLLDEVPMSHAGQVLAAIEMVRPKEVLAFGDFYQIPFIPFVAGYRDRFSSLRPFCDVETSMMQHRCRVSVCAAVLSIYGLDSGLGTCSCCEHVVETEEAFDMFRVDSVMQVPLRKCVKYLTLTQASKHELQGLLVAAGLSKVEDGQRSECSFVSTVHEVQGDTYDEVVVVRAVAKSKPNTIYFSLPHVLVALTRARLKVSYYTTSLEKDAFVVAYGDSVSEFHRDIVRKNTRGYAADGEAPVLEQA